MNYGLYQSTAGALAHMHRHDVLANNLANVETVGFKPDAVDLNTRLPARLEHPDAFIDPQWMLEQLGGGLHAHPTRTTMKQGTLKVSSAPLDVAIEGTGLLLVQAGPSTGPEDLRFTRDGRFTIGADGTLVTINEGLPVLSSDQQPIQLDASKPVRIDESGTIHQDNAVVAQLQLLDADPTSLKKAGANLFRLDTDATLPTERGNGRIRQGYTEASATDPIMTLNGLISASKAAQSNLKLIQYHDNLLGQVFNTFGRVA